MKKSLVWLIVPFFLLVLSGSGHAALTTIGTATYGGNDYKLIWDDDNNGNSVVWLDYSSEIGTWEDQNTWAQSLNSALSISISEGYSVDWGTNQWRLPSTVDGEYVFGYDGSTTGGYNITSSEMGHLFYSELDNEGYLDIYGMTPWEYGLYNTKNFDNLLNDWYWSGTEYTTEQGLAWIFGMGNGSQSIEFDYRNTYGLAIRTAEVSAVPVPGAIFLLGSGLVGLAGFRRWRKGNRC